jgi:hypothetical protein
MTPCRKKSLTDLKKDYHHLYFLVQRRNSSNLSRRNDNDEYHNHKYDNFHDDKFFISIDCQSNTVLDDCHVEFRLFFSG